MGNVLIPQSGRATVGMDIVSEDGALEQLLAPTELGFVSGTLEDAVNTWRKWTLHLTATSREVYERRITPLLLSASRQVAVKWGVGTANNMVWGATDFFRVLRSHVEMQNNAEASALPFHLVLVGELYELDLEQRVIARNGRISDIVAEIAADYGMDTLIEPTGGVPVALVQSFETDLEFIRTRLVPHALNASGLGGYYLYAQAGVLHFHTREWLQEVYVLPYNAAASGLISLDDVQERASEGGGEAQLIVYDPLSGTSQTVTSDSARYSKFGGRLSQAAGKTLSAAHAGPNQVSFEASKAQVRYALNRDRYERVSFAGSNMLDLRAGRIIQMQLPDARDPVNGVYHVEVVRTQIDGGVATAAATAARGEVNGGRRSGAVQGAETTGSIPEPFAAPGKSPNFSPDSSPVLGSGPSVQVKPAG